MKKFRIQNVSGAALYAMLAVTLIILCLFFFGGEAPVDQRVVSDPAISQPAQTDTLIYWMYILFGIMVAVTVVAAVAQLVSSFMDSPKATIKSLLGFFLLVVIMIVSWAAGSGEALVLPGYEGTENVPFWLKLTDMFLYTIYIQIAVIILAIVGFGIAKKFK